MDTVDYDQWTVKNASKIARDSTHKLSTCFQILPSGRRYAAPLYKTNRGRAIFIPSAIRLLIKHNPLEPP